MFNFLFITKKHGWTDLFVKDLLVKVFPNSKIAGSMTLGCRKLVCVINYRLKKYFLEKCKGLRKNASCFTVYFDKLLNQLSNRKPLDTHILDCNDTAICVEKA